MKMNKNEEIFLDYLETWINLRKLSDDELSSMVMNEIWINMDFADPRSPILAEVISRLSKEDDENEHKWSYYSLLLWKA